MEQTKLVKQLPPWVLALGPPMLVLQHSQECLQLIILDGTGQVHIVLLQSW